MAWARFCSQGKEGAGLSLPSHGGTQPILSPKSQLRAEPDPLQAPLFAVPDANSKVKGNQVNWADVSGCSVLLNPPRGSEAHVSDFGALFFLYVQLYSQAIHVNHLYKIRTLDIKLFLQAWIPDWLLPTAHAGVPTHLCWHRSGRVNCLNDDLIYFHLR